MATYDNKVLTGDQLVTLVAKIKSALAAKQDTISFNTAYDATTNKAATMSDIPDISGKQDALVFNTAYNASTNKVATMSDVSGKQDALVFNTAYNASSNKVATMSDIPDTSDFITAEDIGYDDQDGFAHMSDIEDVAIPSQGMAFWEYDPTDETTAPATMADLPDVSDFVSLDDIADEIVDCLETTTGESAEAESLGDALSQLISQIASGYAGSSGLDESGVLGVIDAILQGPYNITEPTAPSESDYTFEYEDPETGDPVTEFDEDGYNAAYADYEAGVEDAAHFNYYDEVYEDLATAVASMVDVSGKQDALVFNTAYNSSSNKVATMADIPSVSGFQTANDVQTAITTALSGITSFSFQIVQTLPQSDISTSTIYLVLKSSGSSGNVYTEYAYINSNWEILGDTQADISTLSTTDVNTIWNNTSAL